MYNNIYLERLHAYELYQYAFTWTSQQKEIKNNVT